MKNYQDLEEILAGILTAQHTIHHSDMGRTEGKLYAWST